MLVAALAGSLRTLLACLVLAGFGFSVLNPSTGKAVLEWFPPRGRGVAMGIKQTGLTLGGLVGALALPPLALVAGWRAALAAGGALALVSAVLTLIVYRSPAGAGGASAAAWPRLGELRVFLRRPGVIVVFLSGLALSVAQSSLLAHLAVYARETFALSPVVAGQILALAQAGGTAGRLAWGVISDRFFGGRRRPGVVVNALIGAGAYALLALGDRLPLAGLVLLALVAGIGAFGWVGLYFALVAEIGGARYAGLLTGVAVAFAWSGVLIGRPSSGCWSTGRARMRGRGWRWPPSDWAWRRRCRGRRRWCSGSQSGDDRRHRRRPPDARRPRRRDPALPAWRAADRRRRAPHRRRHGLHRHRRRATRDSRRARRAGLGPRARGRRRRGAARRGQPRRRRRRAARMLVGAMVAPIGLLLGPIIGAIAGELLAGRKPDASVRAGIGAALGVLTGVVAHFALALVMVALFVWWVWQG